MKTLKIMIIAMAFLFSGAANAQVSVHINIGTPPPWGPVGYTEVRYYYLPDIEAYYDINTAMFIYYDGGVWIHRTYLPVRYENYDLYYGYKVVMTDYRGDAPYTTFSTYKVKYKKGYRGKPQKTFGNNPGNHKSNKHDGGGNKKSGGGNDKSGGNNKGNSGAPYQKKSGGEKQSGGQKHSGDPNMSGGQKSGGGHNGGGHNGGGGKKK
jgi:hypothetical protein